MTARHPDPAHAPAPSAPRSHPAFSALWDETVAAHPQRVFLVFEESAGARAEWSYAEFDGVVARAADRLSAWGVNAGDRVHLALANCPAFIAIWLAAARLGACIVPGDPGLSAREAADQAGRSRAVLGICAHSRAEVYRAGAEEIGLPIRELAETGADVAPGGMLWSERSVDAALPVAGSQLLAVMFTSGTTSRPKGVELSQANYRTVAEEMAAVIGLEPHHRWFVALPLFHANAQYYCFASAIRAGAGVALAPRFSASGYLAQVKRLGATHASLFAAPIRMILARTDPETEPASLEHVWYAQNLGAEHFERFAGLIGCRPTQLYGMTETVAAVTADVGGGRHDSIGLPLPGRRIRVRNADGRTVQAGEAGMLWVRGVPGVDLFRGYLDAPELTAQVCTAAGAEQDGKSGAATDDPETSDAVWFRTGDLVAEREDGGLSFVGRADDVIKVAGENVSLGEVEAVIAQAPGVLEAAVLGEPDPVRDTVPVAYVVPSSLDSPPDAEHLAAWAATVLSPAARPRRWEIIEALPRTSVGKVRRFALRAEPR